MSYMNLGQAIERIKSATHDVDNEYTKKDCINFLNVAMQQAASLLITGNYPETFRKVLLHNGDYLPKNIIKSAGNYPIAITAGRVEILDSDISEIEFRYFATPDNIPEDAEDYYELPFNNDAINMAIIRQAIILALNQNEYNIQQDNALQSSLMQAISVAMNGE